MTDDQKKKPGRVIGSIQQFATFGGDDEKETAESEAKTSKGQDAKMAKGQGGLQSNSQEVKTVRSQNVKTSRRQNVETVKGQDAKKSKLPDDMKQQTVYLPKKLALRLKAHAAMTEQDISSIITELVEQYLIRQEGRL